MPREDRLWFGTDAPGLAVPLLALVRVVGQLTDGWTLAQARSVLAVLGGASQRAAATHLGVSQSTLQASLRAAQWRPIRIALGCFETLISDSP